MDTYGDMVTLLLCFFVLLYSMSTISEDRWRALVMSFNPNAIQQSTETKGNDGPAQDVDDEGGTAPLPIQDMTQEEIDEMTEALFETLKEFSQQESMQNTMSVELEGGKVYLKFNDTAFFEGNSYYLRREAREILSQVCVILDQAANAIEEIRIQGHTAQATANERNKPETDRFLASNRATEVLLFIQENSTIHPARLVSEGMGQWRPVASNDTSESRAANRRVEIIISGRNLDEELVGNSVQTYITRDAEDMGT